MLVRLLHYTFIIVYRKEKGAGFHISPFCYLGFLLFLNLPRFRLTKRFNKKDIRKLIVAPREASRTVTRISSERIRLRDERKVPLAVPIQMEDSKSIVFPFSS